MPTNFRPQTLIPIIFGFLLAVLLEFATDEILALPGWTIWILAGAAIPLGIWVYRIQQERRTGVNLRTPLILRDPADRLSQKKRGMIAIVSLYRPHEGAPLASKESENEYKNESEAWVEAAESLDLERLDFENSNLKPVIAAITAHAYHLRYCWLLTTITDEDSEQLGSEIYAQALIDHLKREPHLSDVTFFHDPDKYGVRIDRDEANVTVKTEQRIQDIFQEADQIGLNPAEIVADFTGGPRSMMLGMVFACVDKERDIQFASTSYDRSGEPTGEILPIIFRFKPELIE